MQSQTNLPEYLTDDFSMYLENMNSLSDPENPELLSNYLSNLFEQLKQMPLLFNGMVDQLAMAISTKVRIDSKNLSTLELNDEPEWANVKPFVGVHADARACITEIMAHAEEDLKKAVLLIHFYNGYDATPLKAEEDEYAQVDDDDESNDYDENY
ncbi:hypothetical protein [Colwellia hornerae]|uniref:Uncharacterized protein n=1 Tax=Colwellia hornerae TaxID=89402 RepID=A0A5C6QK06_9GAMM|nr:hypothetical protein [Colwellia hornerae]TWX53377.1 hypothetical protein ESZ28_10020 [Colwellia hornerae]TWX60197.1 hypothetical protein ESZ26_08795 [Colwellia hornerae]TWX69010.1 hypothetical protein ESZ27_06635 [Colwellia hornerae]